MYHYFDRAWNIPLIGKDKIFSLICSNNCKSNELTSLTGRSIPSCIVTETNIWSNTNS
jgi:hypothetical protein